MRNKMKEIEKKILRYENSKNLLNHCEKSEKTDGCSCGCCHDENDDDDEGALKKIVVASIIFLCALLVEHLPPFSQNGVLVRSFGVNYSVIRGAFLALYLVAYLIVGKNTILGAVKNIRAGKIFGEQFLMSVASLGAVFLGEVAEAVAVMLFYQIGEFFQDFAVDKSKGAIRALIDLRPDTALVVRGEKTERIRAEKIAVGEIIEVHPGERIALDGIVDDGESFVDTSALTGESVPRRVGKNSKVLAGFVNTDGVLKIRVEKPSEQSAVSRILELTQKSSEQKSRSENFVSRFARVYTPIVCVCAALIALVPTVLFGNFSVWIHRALMFLVVSCPCALVISVPLTFFCGIGASSKNGILVKGSSFMERLSKIKKIAFDKTGTLTKGDFEVVGVFPKNCTADELLSLAANAESLSNHPIAKSILRAATSKNLFNDSQKKISNFFEIAGQGISAKIDGIDILAGNARLMKEKNVRGFSEIDGKIGTIVYVSRGGEFCGSIEIADEIKANSFSSLEKFKKLGVKKFVMLTGDSKKNADLVAQNLKIDDVRAELLSEDKVRAVEELLGEEIVAFVGDGVNDSPVLARADVGIAMGALGTDAAIQAADVVLMDDDLSKLALGMKISKKTSKIVWQNIVLSLGVKGAIILLSALGITGMWLAVFGDVGVCICAILNATRAFRVKVER